MNLSNLNVCLLIYPHRTAAVLRTSALTCFQALLQCSMLPSMVADSLLSNVMSHLLSSLDDNSESTRNVAGNILRLLFDLKLPSLNSEYFLFDSNLCCNFCR